MSDVIIRRITREDALGMANIESTCFSDPWSESAFASAADDVNYLFVVAEVSGKLVGMAGLIISFDEGNVTNVAVLPEYRKNGYAREIMIYLLEVAKAQGVTAYTLEVRENNTPAINLYESLGFESVGKRPGFYEHPKEDAIVYWKRDN